MIDRPAATGHSEPARSPVPPSKSVYILQLIFSSYHPVNPCGQAYR